MSIPDPALVLLIGPSGAGKTTFAVANFRPTEIVSSDALRELLTDDAGDQKASSDAFHLLALIVSGRLSRRLTTVIDATNLRAVDRRRYQRQAASFGVPTVAIVFDLPLSTYHDRNQARSDRFVDAHVIDKQAARMPAALASMAAEGYARLFVLTETALGIGIAIERIEPK